MRKDDVIAIIGKKNWAKFLKWMRGQTVGTYKDGEINYYDHDVQAFSEKLETGRDRQEEAKLFHKEPGVFDYNRFIYGERAKKI